MSDRELQANGDQGSQAWTPRWASPDDLGSHAGNVRRPVSNMATQARNFKREYANPTARRAVII